MCSRPDCHMTSFLALIVVLHKTFLFFVCFSFFSSSFSFPSSISSCCCSQRQFCFFSRFRSFNRWFIRSFVLPSGLKRDIQFSILFFLLCSRFFFVLSVVFCCFRFHSFNFSFFSSSSASSSSPEYAVAIKFKFGND